jgi:hypothetical protein
MDCMIGTDLSCSLSMVYLDKGKREGTRVKTTKESTKAIAKAI